MCRFVVIMVSKCNDVIKKAACNRVGLKTDEANSREVARKLGACITELQVDKGS